MEAAVVFIAIFILIPGSSSHEDYQCAQYCHAQRPRGSKVEEHVFVCDSKFKRAADKARCMDMCDQCDDFCRSGVFKCRRKSEPQPRGAGAIVRDFSGSNSKATANSRDEYGQHHYGEAREGIQLIVFLWILGVIVLLGVFICLPLCIFLCIYQSQQGYGYGYAGMPAYGYGAYGMSPMMGQPMVVTTTVPVGGGGMAVAPAQQQQPQPQTPKKEKAPIKDPQATFQNHVESDNSI